MAIEAIDFIIVAAPLSAGLLAVLALRLVVAHAQRRERARIRRILKSFEGT